jgi:hypothetical protein
MTSSDAAALIAGLAVQRVKARAAEEVEMLDCLALLVRITVHRAGGLQGHIAALKHCRGCRTVGGSGSLQHRICGLALTASDTTFAAALRDLPCDWIMCDVCLFAVRNREIEVWA